jgi:agmatinase
MLSPMPLDLRGVQPGRVALLGIPLDENSSYLRGCALGPARVREVISSGSSNLCAEDGTDVGSDPRFVDVGDVELTSGAASIASIEAATDALLAQGARVLSMGGDHSVTYPIVRAYAPRYPGLSLLHFDAHPDLYDDFHGNRFSHASPFARIMEERLAVRLVQVGIRTLNPHQRDQARRFGVEMIQMKDWRSDVAFSFEGPVYLTFDLDALDPAYAPGVSHHEPGGLSVRDVLGALARSSDLRIVGADVVELNPTRDPVGTTAAVAVKLVTEFAARLLPP